MCFEEKSNLTLNKMYLKWMINLIESLNYAVIIHIRVLTGYCMHTYSREKCTRSIVLINLKLVVCRSSCHPHILFSLVSGLCYTKPSSVDMTPMWKLKRWLFRLFLQMLNILTYLYHRDVYNNANQQTHQFDKPCRIFACFLHQLFYQTSVE